MEGDNG